MEETNTGYTIKNVMKSLEILEKLAEGPEPVPLQSLAVSVGLSPTKTSLLLSILNEKGLVEIDAASGSYQIGARSLAFGRKLVDSSNNLAGAPKPSRHQDRSNLVSCSHPIMEELARKYGEAVYMTVIKNNDVLFLNMVDCSQQIKTEPLVGRKFPFFTNAAGKVIKAVDSWDLLEKLRKLVKAGATLVDCGQRAHAVARQATRIPFVAQHFCNCCFEFGRRHYYRCFFRHLRITNTR